MMVNRFSTNEVVLFSELYVGYILILMNRCMEMCIVVFFFIAAGECSLVFEFVRRL